MVTAEQHIETTQTGVDGTKVLFLTTQSHTSAIFVLPYAKYLRERGYDVYLACSFDEQPDGPSYHDTVRKEGFPLMEVPVPRNITPSGDWRALQRTRELIREHKFDIIHTYNSKAGIIGRWAGFLEGVPAILHSNYGLAFFKNGLFSLDKSLLFWGVEAITSQISDRILTISETEFEKSRQYRIAQPPRLVNVDVGVNAEFFQMQYAGAENDTPHSATIREQIAGRTVVASVCRLVIEKGIDTLIRAAKIALETTPELVVMVVGDGPERPKLEALAKELGIEDSVIFAGGISDREEIRQLYGMMDIFCLPTRWESFGLVFAEAMSMGKPVIGPYEEPILTVTEDGVTGHLRELDNSKAFAEAIVDLVKNPDKRETMGAAGRQRVLAMWDEKLVFEHMESIYSELLAKKASG